MESDTPRNRLSEPEMLELETLQREMADEQAAILRLEAHLGRFMTQAAFREFPALKQMSAEQIREFGQIVTSSAGDFAMKVSILSYAAGHEQKP